MLRLTLKSFLLVLFLCSVTEGQELKLQQQDRIVYIGNTMADRMQHDAWLETMLHALHPGHQLGFRNLGFPGDEVERRDRSDNFGSPDQWLTKTEADVIFAFFGYNESLRGEAGLTQFEKELDELLVHMQSQKYNGESAPRIVMFSPIAHENLQNAHLPDGSENNERIARYTETMRRVSASRQVPFVDLFAASQRLYAESDAPLTLNGIHLNERGDRAVAEVIVKSLLGDSATDPLKDQKLQPLRDAVLDKNLYWFSRYRVVDGYNVYGGRSKLSWFGQSNADVMMREMEIFDVMTANRDQRVWAVAQGGDLVVHDDNLPPELPVKSNKEGELEGGRHPYLGGDEAISKMELAPNLKANLFASEEMFPELINPVQMAVDTDGRLFVSVWPSYPHWNPTQPRSDRIVILPDENRDGVADQCIVFADELNSITGFEFWGGGMLVAAPPEIWFLQDTDGDDRADRKVRMLQGVSSADSHHSANAMVIGPDGGLYWSRGIFNVTSMETPTQTYRSTRSGVHRFDPRTFEMSFVFPIGPNPHGNVIDQWGYQFANDGTSGTGSYVNIGKGIGHKNWFEKRVRPVAATGILSSSHFPPRNQGNFLICNTIGFQGVLQHEVKYNGADITAEEIEPILVSSDPNFRPSDIEVGSDGALYVADWCNALIGHMQHNIRDPNRDHLHGRIYRVTHEGRPLVGTVKLKGKPIAEVCEAFRLPENGTRYRARLELSGRDSDAIARQVDDWASALNPQDAVEAQALLECLWVFEEHRIPNRGLLTRLLQADEPRVRAAAIRTLGHWAGQVNEWESLLMAAARDTSHLVRAEAVKAAVEFQKPAAAEAIFEVAVQPTDVELQTVLKYALGQMDAERLVRDTIRAGQPLSDAARAYALENAQVEDLWRLGQTADVYQAILERDNVPESYLSDSLGGLAKMNRTTQVAVILDLMTARDGRGTFSRPLADLLLAQRPAILAASLDRLESLALEAQLPETRRRAFAAWMTATQSGDAALFAASHEKERLREWLESTAELTDANLQTALYDDVRSLIEELPPSLQSEGRGAAFQQPGIHVDYYFPSASNVALETLAKMQPQASGVVPQIVMDVPQLKERDRFALRFTGQVLIPRAGSYTFFIRSDDGSRVYLNDQLLINNDGLHGMVEKNASVDLASGHHKLVVTYFDNGGGDGLEVAWSGPGFKKQPIAADHLSITGGETIHDVAIRALSRLPGHEEQKVKDFASLIQTGRHRAAAISGMREIPLEYFPRPLIRNLVDNLIAYLSEMPAQYRTGASASDAVALATRLAERLAPARAEAALERLKNLDVRIIAIGTIPARMIYDKERIAVQAGKPVEFRFSNSDHMPHNFAITEPGALEEIGLLAEATAREPDAIARQYIPRSDKILLASRLLQPGEDQSLSFETPTTPGIYPYVCTYPGHWRRMFGALYVVDDLEAYQADPEEYLAKNSLPLQDDLLKFTSRNTEWTVGALSQVASPLPHGRSFEVGRKLFQVANCAACHRMNGEGQPLGPDLTKIEEKNHTASHILESLIEPSKVIAEKYQSFQFVLNSGKILTGMIVEDADKEIKVLVDPLAKAAPVVVRKADIEEQIKSPNSIMPKGLLNKLTEEEILDLIAYVFARGDEKNSLFETHQH